VSRSDRILIAAGGAAFVLAAAAGWILLMPGTGQGAQASGPGDAALLLGTPPASASSEPSGSPHPTTIVVDVEGAVLEPGIRELPAGSRVADAVSAAGGYGPDADLEAAAAAINLAERLADGAQVVVPRIGAGTASGAAEAAEAAQPPLAGEGEPGGPLNINTASADQLEALPGVGPVTVDRIIDGRRERPFSSLEDAVERGVLNRGQLDDLEGLATAE
jgi:competence protein ComEA